MDPDTVSAWAAFVAAIAALGTLAIAGLAARYAKGQVQGVRDQLDEARLLRKEQSQPYVVASIEPGGASFRIVDLVVKNLGTTAAHDVRLVSDPPMKRTNMEGYVEVWPSDRVIPTLVPGQEWRCTWDSTFERFNAEDPMPDTHNVTVQFKDSAGESHTFEGVLDWRIFKGRPTSDVKTVHDAAKALDVIAKQASRWSTSGAAGITVNNHDGDARDARRQAEYQERSRELEAQAAEEKA